MRAQVDHGDELMDGCSDAAELDRTFDDLDRINRWLGGQSDVLRALRRLIPAPGAATVLDIGCGGGDACVAIARWGSRSARRIDVTGIDRNAPAVALARRRARAAATRQDHGAHPGTGQIRFATADALHLPFADRAFDIVLMSLTLHHFRGDAFHCVVREMARVARRAVVVNDLCRTWPNYAGAKLLSATLWRRSRLTRHDAPLSVLRGFTAGELERALRVPGLRPARIRRRFFHRLVAVAERTDAPPAGVT